jgi:hypothetical protein
MALMDMLRKLGDRLGIVELAPVSQPSNPVKIQTRTVTLAELCTKIQITEVRELAELPAELSVPFEAVYKAAGIAEPETGWTVSRLEQFLKSDRIRNMDRAEAQQETLRTLAADHVDPADVIKDAVSRDQAMDAFEEGIISKRQEWLVSKKSVLSALAGQVNALEDQQKRIEQEIAAEEKSWTQWRRQKRQREIDMANAVSFLIDRPVISIEEE